MSSALTNEIAVAAAQLVADEGMDYGQAKRKAARTLSRTIRPGDLPSNEEVEDEVRAHLSLFEADTQPSELAALRQLAQRWMQRLDEFRPHLSGGVWRGTANRHSAIHLDLYCDDPKSAEIALLNRQVDYQFAGSGGDHDVLAVFDRCEALGETVSLFLHVLDRDDLRGGLKPDARGRTWRGDRDALARLLESETA